ncbi:MAG: RNA pseudouridine synthase [Spirochaetaceae bacterium]|jgi:23S rRNA pseudouridine1911/1915/1917 synthase|nr:RNA pseudouridine synthase [Spirochaetaceae bacterium]
MNDSSDDTTARILYEDSHCFVINKRPGEAVQGNPQGMASLPGMPAVRKGFRAVSVHRLDVPVSGACLFARTSKSLSFLNTAFAEGQVEKYYRAILEKPPADLRIPEAGELVHWIKTDAIRNKSLAYPEPVSGSKKGTLQYRITGWGERYFFMEIKLITGRHHQIRAQLAALGLCIKGDLKYGARRSEPGGGIRLHSYSLSFPNPAQPEARIHVTAPPPVRDRLWDHALPDGPVISVEGAQEI